MNSSFKTGQMMNNFGNMPQGMNNQQFMSMQPQMMPQQPPQQSGPALKVQLTDKEKGYYSNLLMQADPSGNNKVGGKEGVTFFKRSGIPTDQLKSIWLLAAKTSPEYLLRDEFYLALRLIAYAQNGIQPTEESIRFNLEVQLPKFDPVPLALPVSDPTLPQTAKQFKQPTAEEIAAALPDLDNLNIDALNNLHSLIPSVNQREQEKQQQNQQANFQKQMIAQAKNSPWFLQEEEIQRFNKIFASFDQTGQGFIPSGQMREIMEKTKLERQVCEQVFVMVNPKGLDRFDRIMFAMSMQFLYNKKKGIELPPIVPEEMLMSINPENYFRMKQQMMQQQHAMGPQKPQISQVPQLPQNQPPPVQQQPSAPKLAAPVQQIGDLDSLLGVGGQQQQQPLPNSKPHSPKRQSFSSFPSNAASPQMLQASSQLPLPNQAGQILQQRIGARKDDIQFMTNQVAQASHAQISEMQEENARLQKQLDDLDREYASLKVKVESQKQLLQNEKSKNQQLRQSVEDKLSQVNQMRGSLENVMQERITQYQNQAVVVERKDSYNTYNQGASYSNKNQQDHHYGYNNNAAAQNNNEGGYGGTSLYDYYQQNQAQPQHQSYPQRDSIASSNANAYQENNNNFGVSYGHGQQQQFQQQLHHQEVQPVAQPSQGLGMRFDFDNFDSELLSDSTGFNMGGSSNTGMNGASAGNFDLGGRFDFS